MQGRASPHFQAHFELRASSETKWAIEGLCEELINKRLMSVELPLRGPSNLCQTFSQIVGRSRLRFTSPCLAVFSRRSAASVIENTLTGEH